MAVIHGQFSNIEKITYKYTEKLVSDILAQNAFCVYGNAGKNQTEKALFSNLVKSMGYPEIEARLLSPERMAVYEFPLPGPSTYVDLYSMSSHSWSKDVSQLNHARLNPGADFGAVIPLLFFRMVDYWL